jgi:cytochrome c-type biogenesis protein CcmE
MKGNLRVYLGVLVLVIFGALAFLNFNKTVAPYVSFAEARAAAGGAVQVAGFPHHQQADFLAEKGVFTFPMENEEGEVMEVAFRGVKPGNFDQAEKVVVIGRYDEGRFEANQILVKCPSKYDDQASERLMETEGSGSGSGS